MTDPFIASVENIRSVLGQHMEGLKFEETDLHNGQKVRGFMSRFALEDLQKHFHVYINKQNDVVVLTLGRLSVESKV